MCVTTLLLTEEVGENRMAREARQWQDISAKSRYPCKYFTSAHQNIWDKTVGIFFCACLNNLRCDFNTSFWLNISLLWQCSAPVLWQDIRCMFFWGLISWMWYTILVSGVTAKPAVLLVEYNWCSMSLIVCGYYVIFLFSILVLDPKETTFMNGGQLYWGLQGLYMKVEFSSLT